jgi:two-component system, response regulator FlrC
VVDDELAWRTILETDLKLLGYQVIVASDSSEAMASAEACEVDIAVIDLMLPEPIDGHGLLARLREMGRTMPVIFYTAYPVFPSEQPADESGVLAYVSKSADRADLYALIPPAVTAMKRKKDRQ